MAWYSTGSVTVTNASATVTGVATAWFAGLQVGWGFVGPDGRAYEIAAVASNTSLTLTTTYQGATASGQVYACFPTNSLDQDLVVSLQTLIADFQATHDGAGAGKFGDGTISVPGVRFESDPDTGLRRVATNKAALVAGGIDALQWDSTGLVGDVAFDSNTLKVDAANNRVGIGTGSPAEELHVVGDGRITGNLDIQGSIRRTVTDDNSTINGGTGGADGANLVLYGETHASYPNWAIFEGDVIYIRAVDNAVGLSLVGTDFGIGTNTPGARLDVIEAYNIETAIIRNSSATLSDTVQFLKAARAASVDYDFLICQSNSPSAADNEFRFSGNGNGTCDGSWTGGGADYAEYFEWADGNLGDEDRRGLSVVLDGGKIRRAMAGEEPFGVISGNPSVIGDAAPFRWSGKYLRDEFGTPIFEEYDAVSWTQTDGDESVFHSYAADQVPSGVSVPADADRVTQTRRKLNPAFDPADEYIPRADRAEWDMVGLVGKLRLRQGQPTAPRWIKMRDMAGNVEEWLVR